MIDITFSKRNTIHSRYQKEYPVLYKIMNESPLFWCLKYLPYISRWLSLIYERYLRKLTMDECTSMNIK